MATSPWQSSPGSTAAPTSDQSVRPIPPFPGQQSPRHCGGRESRRPSGDGERARPITLKNGKPPRFSPRRSRRIEPYWLTRTLSKDASIEVRLIPPDVQPVRALLQVSVSASPSSEPISSTRGWIGGRSAAQEFGDLRLTLTVWAFLTRVSITPAADFCPA